ncbi:hypothetical protein [Mesorhizobium caraganae]|uniref:hypothetical protein n=1 Tax=Mesorhizobium caraganae TaxID=483206 RepID=UPI003ECE9AAE
MTRSDDARIHNFLAFSIDGMLIAVATLACDQAGRHGEVAIYIWADRKHLGVAGSCSRMLKGLASIRSSRLRIAKTVLPSNSNAIWDLL